jgi:hypothetical protein
MEIPKIEETLQIAMAPRTNCGGSISKEQVDLENTYIA